MDGSSDRVLAIRTRRGDVQAYGELVGRYQTSVFNVCYRMLGNKVEAEDQAQETFIRAFIRFETFDADRPFGPWIRRIAVNQCLNYLQRASPTPFPLLDEHDTVMHGTWNEPETSLERKEESAEVRNAILELPKHYRAVIELRHYQELSYVEIAETLGIPLSNVKSHLFRARKQLARKLSEND
ncbi:MAG: sigma-70 family RNA polymerase sigma factor [Anaerolineales bacterium]|nr:sigma-70 family RNA polymerase sigma factor [Anaerolineales bacterium]